MAPSSGAFLLFKIDRGKWTVHILENNVGVHPGLSQNLTHSDLILTNEIPSESLVLSQKLQTINSKN